MKLKVFFVFFVVILWGCFSYSMVQLGADSVVYEKLLRDHQRAEKCVEFVAESGEHFAFGLNDFSYKSLQGMYNFMQQIQQAGAVILFCCLYVSEVIVFKGIPRLWLLFLQCRNLSAGLDDDGDEWSCSFVEPDLFEYTRKIVEKYPVSYKETEIALATLQTLLPHEKVTHQNFLDCLADYLEEIVRKNNL